MTHVGWARLNPALDSDAKIGQKESPYKLMKSPNTVYSTHGYNISAANIVAAQPNGTTRVGYERSATSVPYTPRSAYATEMPIAGLPKGIYPIRRQSYALPAVIPKYAPPANYATTPGTDIVPAPLYGRTHTTRSGIEFILIHEERTITIRQERTFFRTRL